MVSVLAHLPDNCDITDDAQSSVEVPQLPESLSPHNHTQSDVALSSLCKIPRVPAERESEV